MMRPFSQSLVFETRERVELHQEPPDVSAIDESMAHLLGVQREIRALTGRPSFASEVWARVERGES